MRNYLLLGKKREKKFHLEDWKSIPPVNLELEFGLSTFNMVLPVA